MESDLNEELLTEQPDSGAIDADEEVYYEPETDSQVVAVEPPIISIGRGKRKAALRKMPPEQL